MRNSTLAVILLGMSLLAGCGKVERPATAHIPAPPVPEPRQLQLSLVSGTTKFVVQPASADNQLGDLGANPAGSVSSDPLPALREKIEISGPTVDGKNFDWTEYRGKVVVVLFWASWCRYCPDAINSWQQYLEAMKDKPFAVVGVSIDQNPQDAISYAKGHSIPFVNILDGKQKFALSTKCKVQSIPTMLCVNKAGDQVDFNFHGADVAARLNALIDLPYDPAHPKEHYPAPEAATPFTKPEVKKAPEAPPATPLEQLAQDPSGSQPLLLYGPTASGQNFDWNSYRGHAVVVIFWTSWDSGSKDSLAELEKLRAFFRYRPIDVVGVNLDPDPSKAREFLREHPTSFENILDGEQGGALLKQYPVSAVPFIACVTKLGKIKQLNFTNPNLGKLLEEIIQEKYDGPAPKHRPQVGGFSAPGGRNVSTAAPGGTGSAAANGGNAGQTGTTASRPGTLSEAKTGSGKKGRGYGGGIYSEPIRAKFVTEQRLVFDVQIPKAMSVFQAEHDRLPKSHEEFMQEIIAAGAITLPELLPGQEYVYQPEQGKLMVFQLE